MHLLTLRQHAQGVCKKWTIPLFSLSSARNFCCPKTHQSVSSSSPRRVILPWQNYKHYAQLGLFCCRFQELITCKIWIWIFVLTQQWADRNHDLSHFIKISAKTCLNFKWRHSPWFVEAFKLQVQGVACLQIPEYNPDYLQIFKHVW